MTPLPVRAFPLVLAAPSGTGKTTIARTLVRGSDDFVFSVSATTRPPRGGEKDGLDYEFVSDEAFQAMVDGGELVEWAEVHRHRYGTPRRNLERAADGGRHVVLDIDVQGARQIRAAVPEAVLVFVFPPSADALVRRLTRRGTERPEAVARRLRNARAELERAAEFDYIVVNDELHDAVERIREIVRSEGSRPSRVLDLDAQVRRMRDDVDRVLEGGLLEDRPAGR